MKANRVKCFECLYICAVFKTYRRADVVGGDHDTVERSQKFWGRNTGFEAKDLAGEMPLR